MSEVADTPNGPRPAQPARLGVVGRPGGAALRRYGTVASVLMLDLDGLKAVNDHRGHAAGDAVLARTGRVLQGAVRTTDVVARLGGDEFAVLSVETDQGAAAEERARLQALLDAAGVPASIGVATRGGRPWAARGLRRG